MSYEQPNQPSSRQPLVIALAAVSVVAVAAIVLAAFLVGRQSPVTRSSTAATEDATYPQVTTTAEVSQVNRYLDGLAVAKGVTQIVTVSYGARNVTETKCPDNEPIRSGHTFTCTLRIDGSISEVTVTIVDDSGTYEVSRPN